VLGEIGSRLVQVTAHRQGRDLAIAGAFGIRAGKRIGVAPIGAANGLQRPAPGSSPAALVRGCRVPVIAVSLEHLTLDLDAIEDAEVGDPVLLLGRDGDEAIDLEELAAWFGLSCLHTVVAVSGRLNAHYR
jgi:alanine racemase